MDKTLIIFDMDGTLVDSSHIIANAINHVRGKLDLPPMPRDAIIGQVNNHQLNPAQYFYEAERFEPIHEAWFSEYYSAHHDHQLQLYDGIRELLTALKAQGKYLAVATNAYRSSTYETLRHLGIEPLFDAVMTAEDVPSPKPAPDMLLRILERLNIPKEEALFIGDGPRDEAAAEAAGIDYIMVDWGFTDHDRNTQAIRSVAQLAQVLGVDTERNR